MKTTFLKSIGGTALALLVLVGGMQMSLSGQDDKGSGQDDKGSGQDDIRHKPSLVGVWVTQVTRRNCETGEPIAAPGNSQNTFAKGGTLLETIGPSIIRSPGNGIWKREHGWNEYSFVLRFMRYDAAGVFVGSGVVRAAIKLDETGDHSTSTATNDVLDVNGNVIGSGCATSVSTRFPKE
ncbi:MAG: hypothetical protein ND895_00685 [Pyrinomonadaceae bacterium]|nr:hypothetical protein [Pyrinomonadaceae bacterium]